MYKEYVNVCLITSSTADTINDIYMLAPIKKIP